MHTSLILPVAEDDIAELFEFHLDHSDRTAHALADEVIKVVRRLEQFPESGSPRGQILEGLRVVPIRRFHANVYYVIADEKGGPLVTILRVLRQERHISPSDFE